MRNNVMVRVGPGGGGSGCGVLFLIVLLLPILNHLEAILYGAIGLVILIISLKMFFVFYNLKNLDEKEKN